MRKRSGRRWWWRLVVPVIALGVVGPVVVPSARAAPAPMVCAGAMPAFTTVRVYARTGVSGLPGGRSLLYCGTSRFGLRHLTARHAVEWRAVAGSSSWATFLDAAVRATLASPDAVRCDSARDSCAFTRRLYAHVVTLVAVAREDGKVITAYPVS